MDIGYSLDVIKAVEAVNNRQKEVMFMKISNHSKVTLRIRFLVSGA